MDVPVLVGLWNVSVSIVDGCRVRSGFKKFTCLLYSCAGLSFYVFLYSVHTGRKMIMAYRFVITYS